MVKLPSAIVDILYVGFSVAAAELPICNKITDCAEICADVTVVVVDPFVSVTNPDLAVML